MSPLEVRASISLASLFALRMLGLFLILPVFAVHALSLAGGGDRTLVGLALGVYGLTQAVLQLPFGIASDRLGRKKVIVFGLLVFAAGSFVAAVAQDIHWTIAGRALQGAGAISAAVMAMLADMTSEANRTRAMAIVGATIGLMFAVSMMAGPLLYRVIGMAGMFALMGILSLLGVLVTLFVIPPEGAAAASHAGDLASHAGDLASHAGELRAGAAQAAPHARASTELLRLNYGIFALQTVQMALFVVVPTALVQQSGLPLAEHWKVYLPVVLLSFLLMMPPLQWAERHGRVKETFLVCVGVMLAVQAALFGSLSHLYALAACLLVYFAAFNLLAAMLPSMISRLAPPGTRGKAIGVYNTMQSLGSFAGGVAGGLLSQHFGGPAVFLFGGALIAVWLLVAIPMRSLPRREAR